MIETSTVGIHQKKMSNTQQTRVLIFRTHWGAHRLSRGQCPRSGLSMYRLGVAASRSLRSGWFVSGASSGAVSSPTVAGCVVVIPLMRLHSTRMGRGGASSERVHKHNQDSSESPRASKVRALGMFCYEAQQGVALILKFQNRKWRFCYGCLDNGFLVPHSSSVSAHHLSAPT